MGYAREGHDMASPKERHGISRTLKTFYGVGDFGFTAMTNVDSYFFNYFLTDLAQFSLPVVSLITTLVSVIDTATSWVYGAIMNSTKPGRYGRYRTWLIRTTWAVPFLYALRFMKIGEGVLPIVIIIVSSVVSQALYTFPFVASISLMTVATKKPEERAALSSTRTIWNNASKLFFSAVSVPLASLSAGLIGEQNQYAGVAFCLGFVLMMGFFAHFKMFEGYERVETPEEAAARSHSEKMGAGDLVRSLFQNKPLLVLMLANFADNVYVFITSGVAIYYFTYVAQMPGLLQPFIMATSVAAMLGAYVSRMLCRRIPGRTVLIATLFGMVAVLVLAFVLSGNPWAVCVLMCLSQAGFAIAYAVFPLLYSDVIVYTEWKTGKNATGWISGLQQFPLKAAIVMRGLIIAGCLALTGWETGMTVETISAPVKQGICMAYMIAPAAVCAVGALLLVLGFKLSNTFVAQCQAELDARRAA